MKISDIDLDTLKTYLKITYTMTEDEEAELLGFLAAAKEIVKNHTGNTAEECDAYEELTVAVLMLTADMFDNRTAFRSASEATPNDTLLNIMSLHDHNFL